MERISIFAVNDPVLVKFGPKGTDPQGRMYISRFTRGALCSQRQQTLLLS